MVRRREGWGRVVRGKEEAWKRETLISQLTKQPVYISINGIFTTVVPAF